MAPFSGHLVSPGLAIALAVQGSSCMDRINLELARQKAECAISVDVLNRLRDLETKRGDALEARLEQPAWYTHPVVGIVLVTVVGLGTVFAVSRL